MALRLNLYHEIQKEAQARRRDPLKLGIIALLFIGVCFVAYYFLRATQVGTVVSEQQSVESEWAGIEPKEKAARTRAVELNKSITVSQNLVNFVEERFHWAPVLEHIGRLVPGEVQITRISGDLRSNQQCQMTIEGVTAGSEPRTIAEDLRTRLASELGKRHSAAAATFVSLEDGEGLTLKKATLPTATFTIRLEFKPEMLKPGDPATNVANAEKAATPSTPAPTGTPL
jgi:Tfp pilus assembly protein PilN